MVIRHSPHRAALLGVLGKSHQCCHQHHRHDRRDNIQAVDEKAIEPFVTQPRRHVFDPEIPALRQTGPHGPAQIKRLDLGPPHQVGKPFQEIGQTDGRHEQNNRLLPHQMPEHEPLHRPGQRDHHQHCQEHRDNRMQVPAKAGHMQTKGRVDQMRKRHLPVLKAHQRTPAISPFRNTSTV